MRPALLFVTLCLNACTCRQPGVGQVGDARLVATPSPVVLPETYLSFSTSVDVTITNSGEATASADVSLDAPFSTAATHLTVVRGDSQTVTIAFTPTVAGHFEGRLHVGALDVPVLADARTPPECQPSDCQAATFEPDAGVCVLTPLTDNTACTTPCVTGVCLSGTCRGATTTTCDDLNACTVDACGPQGCLHIALTCPVTDGCRVAQCDPASGCFATPVADGTPCGEATCGSALVCMNGECQRRDTPNTLNDCSYVEVARSPTHACALTKGGSVRCWGDPSGWQSNVAKLLLPAEKVPLLENTHGLFAASQTTCGITNDGGVRCLGSWPPQLFADGGAVDFHFSSAALQLGIVKGDYCARLASGAVECLSATVSDPVVDLLSDCMVLTDGGVVGPYGLRLVFDAPATKTFRVYDVARGCGALLNSGALQVATLATNSSGNLVQVGVATLVDGGVIDVGSGANGDLSWQFADGGIIWRDPTHGPDVAIDVPGVVALTRHTDAWRGSFGMCALTRAGDVWCWGDNNRGQLGDRSVQPQGVQHMPLTSPASAVVAYSAQNGATLIATGGVFKSWGAFGVPDGGYPLTVGPAEGVPTLANYLPTQLWVLRPDGGIGPPGLPSLPLGPASELVCWGGSPSVNSAQPSVALIGGEAVGLGGAHPLSNRPVRDVAHLGSGCLLFQDGGVACDSAYGASSLAAMTLPLAALRLSTFSGIRGATRPGCAVLSDGSTWCWGEDVPHPVSGVSPYPRQVVGDDVAACALYGVNGVQCWGRNYFGQDGRDDIVAASAVDVAIGEPIVSLSSGLMHVCALTVSGAVKCWGWNDSGQLGFLPLISSVTARKVEW